MILMITYFDHITKLAQAFTAGAKKIRLFPYPDMKARLETSLEEALEAKYLKEQEESRKALK